MTNWRKRLYLFSEVGAKVVTKVTFCVLRYVKRLNVIDVSKFFTGGLRSMFFKSSISILKIVVCKY